MDKILEKLADKLLSLDEASLVSLWDKYYAIVQKFEPTKKWEQAVIILSMIQGMRWKNQLFNVKWLNLTRLEKRFNRNFPIQNKGKKELVGPVLAKFPKKKHKHKGKIIAFNSIDQKKD